MKICPTCSGRYPDDANFCPVDATRLKTLASAPAPAVAPIGSSTQETVGNRFLLGARIAVTPTGEVFQATDSSTGEQVHVKIIHQRALPAPAMADRALRELKQLAKLKSERIARIVDQGKFEDGRVYVALEALSGQTLAQLVEHNGPLPLERARTIVLHVGEALAEAQKSGVIHRDVSPRNVVLVGEAVKVIDFGVAEPVTERVFGTPAFMSPEQAEGKSVDQRSNIYSLATLLYYLLTGTTPFTGDTSALLQQHLHAQPRPPSQVKAGVPVEVDRVVLKALEKSGGRRHLTLRQMLNEVAALGPAGGRPSRITEERARTALEAVSVPEAVVPSMPVVQPVAAAPVVGMPMAATLPSGERPGLLGAAVVSSPRATPTPARVVIEPVRPPAGEVTPAPRREARVGMELGAVAPEKPMAVDEAMRYGQPVSVQPAAMPVQPATVPMQPMAAATHANPVSPAKEVQPQPVAVSSTPAAMVTPQTQAAGTPQPQVSAAEAAPRRAFRETAWFKKGELEEEAEGVSGHSDDPTAGASALPAEVDEGRLTVEDHKRLSLRTGRTEAMAAVKASVDLPGDHMSEAELLAEVDSSRKWLVASGIGVAVVVLIAAVYFLFVRAPAPLPATSGTGTPPAATAPR